MKRTIAFGLIAIFLVSLIPFAFAEEGSSDTEVDADDDGVSVTTHQNLKVTNAGMPLPPKRIGDRMEDIKDRKEGVKDKLNIDRRNCIAKCTDSNRTMCEAKCKTMDKMEDKRDRMEDKIDRMHNGPMVRIKNLADLKIRKINNADIEKFKHNYEQAKERFAHAKDQLKDAKDALKEAREKHDENATLEHGKEYLVKISDVMINNLEKIKSKVQENDNIPEDTANAIVTAIDAQIADLNDIKTKAQNATTKEEVKELAKKLRQKWDAYQHFARLYAARVISARVQGIINEGLVLEKRLDRILNESEAKGIDVDVDAEVTEFHDDITTAKDKFKQAHDKLSAALLLKVQNTGNTTTNQVKQLVDEANALLKESRDALKAAHDVLKEIVQKIKAAMPQANLNEEIEVEVEDVHAEESGQANHDGVQEAGASEASA